MLVHSKLLLSIARSFPRDVDNGVDGGQARLASSEMRVKGEKATGRRRDDQAGAGTPHLIHAWLKARGLDVESSALSHKPTQRPRATTTTTIHTYLEVPRGIDPAILEHVEY